jgi:hypothetical protein
VKKLKLLLILILVFLLLSFKVLQPFWGHHEFNGAYYGMIAKNYIRYGILKTRGAQVNNLYPVPPEQWSLHTNHPATYPLLLSFAFRLFGAHEYIARLISIFASIIGVILLVSLIDAVFKTPYSWLGAIIILFTPLFLYYGSMPVFEPLLFPIIVSGLYLFWTDKNAKRLGLLALICIFAGLIDWPGFWLPIWLIVYEVLTRRRPRVIVALSASIFLSLGILSLHQFITSGTLADLVSVFKFRLGVAAQPYTFYEWFRLLLTRSRAFLGLPIIIISALGLVSTLRKDKADIFFFALISLGMGLSHIFVFRNITWYHDYMLYHLLPFLGLSIGALFYTLFNQSRSVFVVIVVFVVLAVTTVFSTNPFFQALVKLEPHRDCVEMGHKVKESFEVLTFKLNSEKAKECPPFIGFYGELPFSVVVED